MTISERVFDNRNFLPRWICVGTRAGLFLLVFPLLFVACLPTWHEPPIEETILLPPENDSAARDCHGDPLPEGAIQRFGTVRWRHTNNITCIALSHSGRRLASAGQDQFIRVWETATGKQLRRIKNPAIPDPFAEYGDPVSIVTLAFSPVGMVLASGSCDSTVRLWNVITGKELRCLRGHTGSVFAVRFSADGRLLASGSNDGTVILWDVDRGKEIRRLRGRYRVDLSLALSPDGTLVAAGLGQQDHRIIVWNTSTGKAIREIKGHTGGVLGLAFSPDGDLLASGSQDETVRLWQVSTGQEIRRLRADKGAFNTVAFSPDGKTLVVGCRD